MRSLAPALALACLAAGCSRSAVPDPKSAADDYAQAAARGDGVPQLVNTRFQVLFHSPPGVLFTFPSRYWFTIGH